MQEIKGIHYDDLQEAIRLRYQIRPIQQINDSERLSISQIEGLKAFRLSSKRVFELSFQLEQPLQYFEDLIWKLDGHPIFDKRDSLQGVISLHFFDMIQAQLKSKQTKEINAHPMEPFINCLFNKLAFTPFLKDLVRLIINFVKTYTEFYQQEEKKETNELVKIGKLGTPSGLKPDLHSLLPSQAECQALASTFKITIMIIHSQNLEHPQPTLLTFKPASQPNLKLFRREFQFTSPLILKLDSQIGWIIQYSESEQLMSQLLNYNLISQTEQIFQIHPFGKKAMLDFVRINCGCCPHIRRSTLIAYLERHFPPVSNQLQHFLSQRRFFPLKERRVMRPLCPKGSPIPFETLRNALGQQFSIERCEKVYNQLLFEENCSIMRKKKEFSLNKQHLSPIQRRKLPNNRSKENCLRCIGCCFLTLCND